MGKKTTTEMGRLGQAMAHKQDAMSKKVDDACKGMGKQPKLGYADGGMVWNYQGGHIADPSTMGKPSAQTANVDPLTGLPAAAVGGVPAATPAAAATPALGTTPAAPRLGASATPAWNYSGGHIAMAQGGMVHGPGGPTEDKVPAQLSNGEYVLPADTVAAIGKPTLDALKASTHKPVAAKGYANGVYVDEFGNPTGVPTAAGLAKKPPPVAADAATAPAVVPPGPHPATGPTGQGFGAMALPGYFGSPMAPPQPEGPSGFRPAPLGIAPSNLPAPPIGADGPTPDAAIAPPARPGYSDRAYAASQGQSYDGVLPAKPAALGATNGMVPKQTEFFLGQGIPRAALDQPAVPDNMRGQIVRNARPDQGAAVNLGDYGSNGTTIFGQASKPGGKIDTFTGAGGGTNTATGYAPKGVDFGFKPGEVDAYKQSLNDSADNRIAQERLGREPVFQPSAETLKTQAQIQGLSKQLQGADRATQRQIQGQIAALHAVGQQQLAADQATHAARQQNYALGQAAIDHGLNRQAENRRAGATNALAQQRLTFEQDKYGEEKAKGIVDAGLAQAEKAGKLATDKEATEHTRMLERRTAAEKRVGEIASSMGGDEATIKQRHASMNAFVQATLGANGKNLGEASQADHDKVMEDAELHQVLTEARQNAARPNGFFGQAVPPETRTGVYDDVKPASFGDRWMAGIKGQKNSAAALSPAIQVGDVTIPTNALTRGVRNALIRQDPKKWDAYFKEHN
jgi:hypothetical protein